MTHNTPLTFDDVVEATVTAFNNRRLNKVGQGSWTITSEELISPTGSNAFMKPLPTYYKSFVMMAEDADRETAKQRLGMNDKDIDKILSSINSSLDRKESDAVRAVHDIKRFFGKNDTTPAADKFQEAARKMEETGEPIAFDELYPEHRKDYVSSSAGTKLQDTHTSFNGASTQSTGLTVPDENGDADTDLHNDRYSQLGRNSVFKACRNIYNEMTNEYYTYDDMRSGKRDQKHYTLRHLIFYVQHCVLPSYANPLGKLGESMGRDHTTVLHSVCKIADKVKEDDQLTMDFLNRFIEKIPLHDRQKKALLTGNGERFRHWSDLEKDVSSSSLQPSSPGPAAP